MTTLHTSTVIRYFTGLDPISGFISNRLIDFRLFSASPDPPPNPLVSNQSSTIVPILIESCPPIISINRKLYLLERVYCIESCESTILNILTGGSQRKLPFEGLYACIRGWYGTRKSVVSVAQKCASWRPPLPLEVPLPLAPAPPALHKHTILLHSALKSALLQCMVERFCSSH